MVMKHFYTHSIFMVFVICLIAACNTENTPEGMDPIVDPSEGVDGSGVIEASDMNSVYTHPKPILDFAVDFGALAIADEDGLYIKLGDETLFFSDVEYSVVGMDFNVSLRSISDLIFNGDGLYIAAEDHLLLYDDGDFYGAPLRVHKMKYSFNQSDVIALWEWYLNDELGDGVYRSELELDDDDEISIDDEWPCLDIFSPEVNFCESYRIENFSRLERFAMVGQEGRLITIPTYGGIEDPVLYNTNSTDHLFDRVTSFEYIRRAKRQTEDENMEKLWWNYGWYTTNRGLALSKNELGTGDFDVKVWTEFTTSDNGVPLRGLGEINYYTNNSLVTYSNDPAPYIHYIDYVDETVCSVRLNGIPRIDDMFWDNGTLVISTGREIIPLEYQMFFDACGF